ncbi:MAG: S8 family serine peptidase [candidate division KSB1 bacterium]|nr:S8 family serine peptidase [candidate division KSB1 bacterium]
MIVGIMDTGVMEVEAIQGRIVGGENFTGDGVPATSTANLGHGTFVATAVGANVIFLFNPTGSFAQAVKRYLPSAVISNYGGTGLDAIPMVGIAPFCQFYALKIFNIFGFTTNSIILAAFDRTIELKDKYNRGEPGGVNIQVLNGSFGGASLFAGDDPFFAGMVSELQDVGIVTCFSAGNSGPAGMTVGDPGLARNNLTVGASSIAAYEKIAIDLIFGLPGLGGLWRANDIHQTALFSSRGPTPDGRMDPDIIAPGDWIYGQSSPGSVSIGSGTSYSSPMVAGAAALLLSAHPGASPEQVRGALLYGADPDVLEDHSGNNDQGFGFLDVYKAHQVFGVGNPPDQGAEKSKIAKNLKKLGIKVYGDDHFVVKTGWLLPGERKDIFFRTLGLDRRVVINVTVTAELPPSQQNQLFGDDILVTVASAKTSFGDYRTSGFVLNAATFTMEEQDIEFGISRITVLGDWTNAGRVKARVEVMKVRAIPSVLPVAFGTVTQGEIDTYSLFVPPGASELDLALAWDSHWGRWPTNDLDVLIFDPNGNLVLVNNDFDFDFDGLSLDTPEKIIIHSPMPGTWTLLVNGFTVWDGVEQYVLLAGIPGMVPKVSESGGSDLIASLPTKFDVAQNYPNPFNPSTQINYQLPEESHVTIRIYDIRGNLVRVLEDAENLPVITR